MESNKQTVLVAGGTNYVGSHLVAELVKQNYNVIVLDEHSGNILNRKMALTIADVESAANKKLPFFIASLANTENYERIFHDNNISTVIDCTSYLPNSEIANSKMDFVNYFLARSINLIATAKKYNCKNYIYISSTIAFSNCSKPKDQDDPFYYYSIALHLIEYLVNHYARKDFKTCVLRCGTILGTHPSHKIGDISNNILNQLIDYEQGTVSHVELYNKNDFFAINNFIHIQDACNAIINSISFLEQKCTGTCSFNIACNTCYTLKDLIQALEIIANFHIDKLPNLDFVDNYQVPIDLESAEDYLNLNTTHNIYKMCTDAIEFKKLNAKKYFK